MSLKIYLHAAQVIRHRCKSDFVELHLVFLKRLTRSSCPCCDGLLARVVSTHSSDRVMRHPLLDKADIQTILGKGFEVDWVI